MIKEIEAVLPRPENFNMVGDGFRVYNYFPSTYNVRHLVDPFLMLDFNPEFNFGPSAVPRGVGAHPHKGFETVTIAYQGHVAHHDSFGNKGIIHPGDVQWMTAGAGLLHKEYHEENFSKTGGAFEMVQLWVNLPKKDKLAKPGYQAITANQTGKVNLDNNGGVVNVIAGNCNGVKGPANTFSEMNVFDIRMNKGAVFQTSIPPEHNTSLLIVKGQITTNKKTAARHQFVLFKNIGQHIEISADEDSTVLLLSGIPIKEPIAQYGPFVMNNQAELKQAMEEFHAGKFGYLD